MIPPPRWDIHEILRYARADQNDSGVLSLIDECIKEAEPVLSYRVCCSVLDVGFEDDTICLGSIHTASTAVRKAINGCEQVLLFAATVGAPLDRLIHKYSRLSPAKAVILHAIGAERVESVCDVFCQKMSDELKYEQKRLRTRVSPGYGDIELSMQRDIFAILDCPRQIGVTLNDNLLMSPSKSVTAIAGIAAL